MSSEIKPQYIAVAGNIGVGKTTLTRLLCEQYDWLGFYENFVENPYLEDFYEDMRGFAFQSQVFFLKERIKDHFEIHDAHKTCVQDRTIYEDAEIFARNLYDRKMMSSRDYAVYADLYRSIKGFLRPPDFFIYLQASAWTLISRIRKRGRTYEQSIDKEYLLQLNATYEQWAKETAAEQPVLIINTDDRDIVDDLEWQKEVLVRIESFGREVRSKREENL